MSEDPLAGFPESLRARFRPSDLVGRGGMGAVYRAEAVAEGRVVAVKVMVARAGSSAEDRFRREAEVLSGIDHPGVVRVHEWGVLPEGPYLVMDLVEGRSLDHGPGEHPVLPLLLEVAGALEVIHAKGLVHRDVKPANLVVTPSGRPILLDFGLVLATERTALTRTGTVVGTLAFLAPELLLGERATPAADWYSWGATLFQLVERRLPFPDGDALVAAALAGRLPPLEASRIRPGTPVDRLVRACLVADPGSRPPGLAALRALAGVEDPVPRVSPPPDRPLPPPRPAAVPVAATAPLPSGDQTHGPDPAAGRSRVPVALTLAALAVLGALLPAGRPETPPPVPPVTPVASPEVPRGPTVAERVRGEALAVLDSGAVDPELHDIDADRLGEGRVSDLGLDPVAWPRALAAMPSLLAAIEASVADAGPEPLPEATRREYEAVDRDLRARGLPPTLGPLAATQPGSPTGWRAPPPGTSRGFLPATPGPWLAAMLEAIVELDAERAKVSRASREWDLGAGGAGGPLAALAGLGSKLDQLYRLPRSRAWFSARVARAEALLWRLLLATGRSLAREPATEVAAALVFHEAIERSDQMLHAAVGFLPVDLVLGKTGATRAGALVKASWLIRQRQVHRHARLPVEGLEGPIRTHTETVLSGPRAGPGERSLASVALGLMLATSAWRKEGDRLLADYRRFGDVVREASDAEAAQLHFFLLDHWRSHGPRPDSGERAWIRDLLARVVVEDASRKALDEARRQLGSLPP